MSLSFGADLVESIGATDHHARNQAHELQTLDHQRAQGSGVDTDHDSSGLGRVAQGAHQVEDRGDPELAPWPAGVLHGWVVGLCKQEAESVVLKQAGDFVGLYVVDPAANLFQNVR